MDSTKLTPAQVSSQLAKPLGELGRAVAEWMARHNAAMSKAAYSKLNLDHGSRVLEIGPGNGSHVNFLVTHDNAVRYTGLDISPDMVEVASENNAEMLAAGRVHFVQSQAEAMPFPDASFDRIVSVNCIYFWDIPKALGEIHRVLVAGGRVVTASSSPETMRANPLISAQHGFKNIELSKDLLMKVHREAGFDTVAIEDFEEAAKRMDGTPYVRNGFLTVATK